MRLDSYPMSLREPVSPIQPGFLAEYAARPKQSPMSLEDRQKQNERMAAAWGLSPDTKFGE